MISLKRTTEVSLVLLLTVLIGLNGCTNKFNQTGSWLIPADPSLSPKTFNSADSLNVKITTSQINLGSANGSNDTVLCLGSVPWSEADLLLAFYSGLDSIYYATKIVSARVILHRANYDLQPAGYDVHSLRFEGYAIDSSWLQSSVDWDSVARLPRESSNIILTPTVPEVSDSTVVLQIDTGIVRHWGNAAQDTTYKNYGFIVRPLNVSGIVSVYSSSYTGTGFEPMIEVACVINGVPDTVRSNFSSSVYAANTSITAPSHTFALQSGTGLHGSLVFDLSGIPNYSVINYAELSLFENPVDTLYSGQSPDSLWAYYQSDPTAHSMSVSGVALSTKTGHEYTFPVTVIVQQMLNYGNYGFIMTRSEDYNNLDARFIYNENAPDSLKPRLRITYTPAVKKK